MQHCEALDVTTTLSPSDCITLIHRHSLLASSLTFSQQEISSYQQLIGRERYVLTEKKHGSTYEATTATIMKFITSVLAVASLFTLLSASPIDGDLLDKRQCVGQGRKLLQPS